MRRKRVKLIKRLGLDLSHVGDNTSTYSPMKIKKLKVHFNINSKFEWTPNNIRIETIISAPIWSKVLALLDVRHPKLQSFQYQGKLNNGNLRKWQKPWFRTQFGAPEIFFVGFTSTSSYTMFQAIILWNLQET